MNSRFLALLPSACALVFSLVGSAMGQAEPQPPVAYWSFDGDLLDRSGHGNDAYGDAATFVAGHKGRALSSNKKQVVSPDCSDLRLAPGLKVDCWVRFASLAISRREILVKRNEYMLRVDPANEGADFAFFAYLEGWEPRARTNQRVEIGKWYHIQAGWDGKEVWIMVDGKMFRDERPGTPSPTSNPLTIGPIDGQIDELRIDNPEAKNAGVAYWPFDGNTRDASGHGHDIEAAHPVFVPGRNGTALDCSAAGLAVSNDPDFQLAPGFRIECSAYFAEKPTDMVYLVQKPDEYQLRVNPPKEGGRLAFFVNLGGWEPRVTSDVPLQTGVWYRIIAQWDGQAVTLDVNGKRSRSVRAGMAEPSEEPMTIGSFPGYLDDLRIVNPKLPVVRFRGFLQEHAILRTGRREKITAIIENSGSEAQGCTAELDLPEGVECHDPPQVELGTLATGAKRSLSWTVSSTAEANAVATFRLTGKDMAPVTSHHLLPFFAATDPSSPLDVVGYVPRAANSTASTYYIDSAQGDNRNAGTSESTPWRDFTNINGKTLGPGERLLIKRGSIINQQLEVSATGTPEAWAEIGAYGEGPRPTIRRNWDIADRCALIHSPDYLHISSLVVSYAAQGLVVDYRYKQGGHVGLVIEDCIAHHIEGLYRPNANGIPEWRDRQGPTGSELHSSAGFAMVGASARNLLLRDCEMFQCSWGFFVKGEDAIVDRVYCHDNYALNTSPHPAMVAVRRSYLQNSVFDAPGFHASAGTMGIMLVDPQGLIVRNCTFRNQPDSGSHDEGGIDFEAAGSGCLVDHCTFQNEAGAAIEVLGLRSPQIRNLEIARNRFIKNNVARKLGPAEVYVWGKSPNPEVCCSTGTIHDNGYVTNPGVEFYVNEVPKLTQWALRDNHRYYSVAALKQAMPYNEPPTVSAGPDIRTSARNVTLAGKVTDDGKSGQKPKVKWEVLEGPGNVTFADPAAASTTAAFPAPGDYLLRLVADDGELWLSDMVAVHILPPGGEVARAWEFNAPLDKEGWSEVNTGTKLMHWNNATWPTKSDPVKYVAGSYYIVALEDTTDAHLLSATGLGVPLADNPCLVIRFQNHTPATSMRFRFTTEAQPDWQEANGKSFAVVPNDNGPREYVIDMADVPGWRGTLKQLRLDLANGKPLTGTCRIDYIWIGSGLSK